MAARATAPAQAQPTPVTEELAAFTEELFAHLPRADQRRWAAAYLRGLLTSRGRKSVRRLAAAVSDSPTAAQSLHQFVNASPWDWNPALEQLVRWTERRLTPTSWTVGLAVLPKRGSHSVGVHHRAGQEGKRSVNCQVAVGLFLSDGQLHLPVDWRLLLPEPWSRDPGLRRRTRIPDDVRHRPVRALVLDMLDSLAARSAVAVPLVADLSAEGTQGAAVAEGTEGTEESEGAAAQTAALLAGLSRRGQDFVVAVPGSLPVLPVGGDRSTPAAAALYGEQRLGHGGLHPYAIPALAHGGGIGRVQIRSALVRLPEGADAPARPYRLFARTGPGDGRHARLWITSLVDGRADELLRFTGPSAATAATLRTLRTGFGLLDFGGRSYPGWHHHMTLASAAYAYSRLAEGDGRALSPGRRSA